MRALITGATGFVGRSLVEDLLDRGHDVRVLAPDARGARALLPEAVAVHPGAPADEDSVRNASSGVDTIFHLAESEHPSSHRSYESYSQNLLGTTNILSAAELDTRISRIVIQSSIAATGPSRDGLPLTEESELRPLTNYGRCQANMEVAALRHRAETGSPVVIIRSAMTYGEGDRNWQPFFELIEKSSRHGLPLLIPGRHRNLSDFCYVKNLTRGMIDAAQSENTVGRTYFLSDARPYTFQEIIDAVAGAYHLEPPRRSLPRAPLLGASHVLDALAGIFGFTSPLTPRGVRWMTTNYWICSCGKARTDFGYSPEFDLVAGLGRTVRWLENGAAVPRGAGREESPVEE